MQAEDVEDAEDIEDCRQPTSNILPRQEDLMAQFFALALDPSKAAVLISECECRPDAGLSANGAVALGVDLEDKSQ